MISVKDAAELIELSPKRIKQIVKEGSLEIERGTNGVIRIPNKTMRELLVSRGAKFKCRKVVIAIQKGGVGKTAITLNVAIGAAKRGYRVLIIDLDPEVCASRFLAPDGVNLFGLSSMIEVLEKGDRVSKRAIPSRFDGVWFLPSKPKMRRIERQVGGSSPKYLLEDPMKGVEERFDLVLFDLPPAFNTIESAAYITGDLVICPVDEDVFSIDSFVMTMEDIKAKAKEFDLNPPPIKLLRNLATSENRLSYNETYEELMKDHGDKILPFEIKQRAAVKNSINNGQSIFDIKGEAVLKYSFSELISYILPPCELHS